MGAGGKQAMAASVGLLLFAIAPKPAFFALLLAYAASVLLLSALDAQRWFSLLPRTARLALLLLLASPGVAALVRVRPELLDFEGLRALPALVAERVRLEASPQIAPPLVSAAEPQRFFVNAAARAEVRVRFGPRARTLTATEIGQGLYRVDYDPRRDGPPSPSDGALIASIFVGPSETTRTLRAVTPLPHPRWIARSPDGRLAASVSEETDELVVASARGMERRVAVGDGPSDCVFVTATLVAVAHRDEPDVWIVDAESGSRVARIAVGRGQQRLALSPDDSVLAVARSSARPELALVSWPAGVLDTRIALDAAPDWIAFGPDASTLIVSSRNDAMLRRFRRENGAWRTDASLHLGRAAATLARSRDGARIYATTTDYRPAGPPN
ncbi:MAG: YncE family protein, partial [Polyangiales bacterium]